MKQKLSTHLKRQKSISPEKLREYILYTTDCNNENFVNDFDNVHKDLVLYNNRYFLEQDLEQIEIDAAMSDSNPPTNPPPTNPPRTSSSINIWSIYRCNSRSNTRVSGWNAKTDNWFKETGHQTRNVWW